MRSIRRRPMLSATIVVTFGIGIGTNTAVFSVIDATLLRPTPYVDAGRAVILEAAPASGQGGDPKIGWARTWAAAARSIDRVEARRWRSVLITGAATATRRRLIEATPGYLPGIGARPLLGRLLVEADSRPGAPPVVVIAATLWRSHFGQRADVVGAAIGLDGIVHQIVGVAPDLPSDVPGLTFSLATALAETADTRVRTVAWIRPGVSFETAQADVGAAAPIIDNGVAFRPRLARPNDGFWRITVFRTIELGMIAAALLLIAIAGVNVVNLLFAAGEARLAELAIRRALGAGPRRVIRLMLIETVMLALAGAGIGLGMAWAIVRALTAVGAGAQLQTQLDRIRVDPVVIGFTLGLALVTAIAVGLAPAIRGARAPMDPLKGSASRSVSRLRRGGSTLVAVETALSALRLVAAGLVGRTFLSMHFADRGFDADRVLAVRLALPAEKYATAASRDAFLDTLLDDLSRQPGIERTGIGYGAAAPFAFTVIGRWSLAGSNAAPSAINAASSFVEPGYFALMGIPILQGTDFTAADAADLRAAIQPAIVSRSLARRFWPDGNPVGTVFEITSPPRVRRYRVIGVAGDVSVWGLLSPTCRDCDMQVYAPLPETRQYTDVLMRVRPGTPIPAAALALRAAVARLDPDIPSDDGLETAEAGLSRFIRVPRFTAVLFSALAGLAILLVAVGLAAVVSHSVAQRTREMGIRLALGAAPVGVLRLVIVQGLRPALAGLGAGLAVALLTSRFLGALLYGLSPTDPLTLIGAPLLLMAIAVIALLVPALRATRVDPLQALRTD
jgi:predicted permease